MLTAIWPHFARKKRTPMSDKAKGRTVQADGEAVKRLRESKGWSMEKLATRALCAPKTIKSIECGEHVFLTSLSKVAKVLGVEPGKLLPSSANLPEPAKIPNATQISFTINMHFSSLDETKWLANYLQEFFQRAGVAGEIEVLSVREGQSVVIDLASSREDAYNIACALVDRRQLFFPASDN
jgi:transcriptional regulator with XRE-family HTH domain